MQTAERVSVFIHARSGPREDFCIEYIITFVDLILIRFPDSYFLSAKNLLLLINKKGVVPMAVGSLETAGTNFAL